MAARLKREPVEIRFYSGSRPDETPLAFTWCGERYTVERLLEERLLEMPDGSRERQFRVEVSGGRVFTLVQAGGHGYVLQEEI